MKNIVPALLQQLRQKTGKRFIVIAQREMKKVRYSFRFFFCFSIIAAILISGTTGCLKERPATTVSSEPANIASESMPESEPIPESEASEESQSEAEIPIVEKEEEPDNDWQFDTPENHGMDASTLAQFHDAVDGVAIYSAVTAKDGYIVDEYYKEGYDENSVFRLNSCTKSVTGALIGIAINEGYLSGVDAKLSDFFPQLADSADTLKQEVTIEHLLEHTSGIYWSEWSGGPMFRQLVRSENWVDFVLSQPMASKPGSTFNYTTGGSHLLAAVIQQATGENAFEFGIQYLFDPLGIESVEWRTDPQDVTDGGNGISMSARDAAKFGQLYLDGGKWRGKQIIPEEWVLKSTTPQTYGSPGTGEYGYQWWLKTFGAGDKYYDVYYTMGYAGQYIFVVPELKLVTVITSSLQDTYAPQYYFNDYIIAACG